MALGMRAEELALGDVWGTFGMNKIGMEDIDNLHFWVNYFGCSYPNAYDKEQDVFVSDLMQEICTEESRRWWDTFTGRNAENPAPPRRHTVLHQWREDWQLRAPSALKEDGSVLDGKGKCRYEML